MVKKLQFSIAELTKEAADGPFYFDAMVDISDLASMKSNDIRSIEDVHVKGFVVADKLEFIFSFTINGEMILPCARTLVDVPYAFNFQADEVFSEVPQSQDDDEEEVHYVSGEMLDLTPYIKENIILQMPYRVFSDEAGVQEGEGWDFYDEDSFQQEKSQKVDPRLAKLQQLMDKKED